MASYATGPLSSPPPLSSSPSNRRMKSCARRCERACCTVATYFPLAFVYSLTTWAVWVDAGIGFNREQSPDETITYSKKIPSAIGVMLYILLNACYTTAVFTDPGSPTNSSPSQRKGRYSVLPTSEPNDPGDVQNITVSSSGGARYCKKCQVPKPDRAHHCSTCKRCVLKMDHHCPWLATCLGLHNYKAFVLFLIYVSLFCWACFFNTAFWIYHELFESKRVVEDFGPVNVILLTVLSGIIGLVITGFTSWHIYLVLRGQTTIECLEKTRYLSGVRRQVEANRQEHASHSRTSSEGLANNLKRFGDQVLEFHANAIPGASRFEEGEEHGSPTPSDHLPGDKTPPSVLQNDSPAQRALRSTYRDIEHQRESDRYEEYVREQESSKLPNAFDLGWRRNLRNLFGPSLWLWWLPVCNTVGDGWRWEVSDKWVRANEEASRQREERLAHAQSDTQFGSSGGHIRGGGGAGRHYSGNDFSSENDGNSAVSMHTLRSSNTTRSSTRGARGRGRGGGTKMRREFDTNADGEVASFQVSDDSDDSDSDSDDDIGQMGSRSKFARRFNGEDLEAEEDEEAGWGGRW